MASERVSLILRSKTELTHDQIAAMSDGDAWQLVYSMKSAKTQKPKQFNQICMTGFSPSDKERLWNHACDAGLVVVQSVTASLAYLVVGPNAGPAKLKKAKEQEAVILTEDQFMQFLEDGEIPS